LLTERDEMSNLYRGPKSGQRIKSEYLLFPTHTTFVFDVFIFKPETLWKLSKRKVTVIKTLALPKLIHLFTSLPNLKQSMLNELNKLFFNFIWDGKTEKN
jgi:hypothetical protein